MKIKLFGFDFILEYSFFLMLSFGIISGAQDIAYLLIFSVLHELGHILTLLVVGGKIERLTLSFYGLALRYRPSLTDIKEIFVILSGPLVNLLLYIIIRDDINLLLFVLNMLPVYPLDGGRMMRIALPEVSKVISIITLIIALLFSVYLIICFRSFSLALISCYLLVYSLLY